MSDAPKRRGRPPGSKNRMTLLRPKPIEAAQNTTTRVIPAAYPTEYAELSATTKVRLKKQQAMGDSSEGIETEWPAGWPLPVLGQLVISSQMSGKVRWVEFDLDLQTINITLE